LVLCILLGGASTGGYLANACLELIAVALIGSSLIARTDPPQTPGERQLGWLAGAGLAVVALQFLPLPLAVWEALPGRKALLSGLHLAGIPFSSGYYSLIPHHAMTSAVWLLPALGIALAMMRARFLCRARHLAIALVAAMCFSITIGAMQVASGGDSPLYFYHFTNRGFAVGFFANANHMASLLLVAIPFQAALLRDAMGRERKLPRSAGVMLIGASFLVTLVGLFVVGSLSGYGLAVPVSLASAAIVFAHQRTRKLAGLLLVPAVLIGIGLILASKDGQALLDAGTNLAGASRHQIWLNSWHAIRDFFPLGTGLGTFVQTYSLYENPFAVTDRFINHAHNDYIELLLELGLPGLLLVFAFLAWWARKAWQIWSATPLQPYPAAAVIATATVLVHETVDYPLRTAAMSAVFAASLVLMAGPTPRSRAAEREVVFGASEN
jgi:O-antigen ligase